MIEEKTIYVTSDGKQHATKELAAEHNIRTKMACKVYGVLKDAVLYGPVNFGEIVGAIIENREDIINALKWPTYPE